MGRRSVLRGSRAVGLPFRSGQKAGNEPCGGKNWTGRRRGTKEDSNGVQGEEGKNARALVDWFRDLNAYAASQAADTRPQNLLM